MDSDDFTCDEWKLEVKPTIIEEEPESMKNDTLPPKSKKSYESAYDNFMDWKQQHETKYTTESIVMAYFKELSKKYKPSTLWSIYSMLKATLKIREGVDIDTYHIFKMFMKKQSQGFKSQKSKVLSPADVNKFLAEAPNNEYLAKKVALIFGICGGCRSNELVNIRVKDITKQGNLLVVNLAINRTNKPRTFIIGEEFTKIVQEYADLRPKNAMTDRFFLSFQKGKCTQQVIGVNTFSKMPKSIAAYLKLEDPASYTGHVFRGTAANMHAESGVNIITLKRLRESQSNNVEEGHTEESVTNRATISNVTSTSVNFTTTGSSEPSSDASRPKHQKIETVTSQTVNDGPPTLDITAESSTGQTFIFKNCTVVINQK